MAMPICMFAYYLIDRYQLLRSLADGLRMTWSFFFLLKFNCVRVGWNEAMTQISSQGIADVTNDILFTTNSYQRKNNP